MSPTLLEFRGMSRDWPILASARYGYLIVRILANFSP
jgi:hypothetical protein